MTFDARKEHYMLVDMDGYICLFTNMRLDRDTIPKDLYCYDVRDDDDCSGTFAEVQRYVMVNHWGTIISKEPLPMNKFHCFWPDRDAFYIPDASLTLDEFHKTPLPALLEPYLTPEGKEAMAGRLPDLIAGIQQKSFDTRTGEEQEHLWAYWQFHAKELSTPAHAFLGISEDRFHAWKEGRLTLSDGSYHPMENSSFRLSSDALLTARQLLRAGGIEGNCSSMALRDPDNPARYSAIPLLSQFIKHLPAEKDCVLSSFYDSGRSNLLLYTPDDDFIALITQDEILYKEDFAIAMESSGFRGTELEWNVVWKQFSQDFRASIEEQLSLAEQVQTATSKVQGMLTREHIQRKNGLDKLIDSADTRASAPPEPKPQNTKPDPER